MLADWMSTTSRVGTTRIDSSVNATRTMSGPLNSWITPPSSQPLRGSATATGAPGFIGRSSVASGSSLYSLPSVSMRVTVWR